MERQEDRESVRDESSLASDIVSKVNERTSFESIVRDGCWFERFYARTVAAGTGSEDVDPVQMEEVYDFARNFYQEGARRMLSSICDAVFNAGGVDAREVLAILHSEF